LRHRVVFMFICCVQGKKVAQFDDNELWYPGMHQSNTVYLTDQWVVSLCRVSLASTLCTVPWATFGS
jgi:hypothetical protein